MDRLEGGEAIMSRLRAKVYVNVRVRADGPTKVRHPPLTVVAALRYDVSPGGTCSNPVVEGGAGGGRGRGRELF